MVAVLMLVGTVYLFKSMPTGFIPSQDQGFAFGILLGPQDISFDSMARHAKAVGDIIRRDPAVEDIGVFVPGLAGLNGGLFFAHMKPRSERRVSVDQIIERLRPQVFAVPGVLTFIQNPPPITINGQGGTNQYQLTLQSTSLEDVFKWAPQLTAKMRQIPGFVDVTNDMQVASPQLMVNIDRDRAAALGITPQQVQDGLYSAFGTREVSVMYAPADQYSVILEALPEDQRTPESLSKLYLRSSSGSLVPLDAVVRTHRRTGPLQINHLRAIAGGDGLLQFAARIFPGSGRRAGRHRHQRPADAHHHHPRLPGHGEGVSKLVSEPDHLADRGHCGDLYCAGCAL